MSQADRDYLLARADQERGLAAQASADIAREIHLRLAREYQQRADGLGLAPRAANDGIEVKSARE